MSGSIAYDHIMFFNGEFKDSLIPEELQNLSVSFLAESRKTYFGGCAPNIAYTMHLLGENPVILGVAGNDFDKYKDWLSRNHLSTECVIIEENSPTAAAFILSDNNQNQVSIFSPVKASDTVFREKVQNCDSSKIHSAILAPDTPQRMLAIAETLQKEGVPYLFDPGQAISALSKEYLAIIIEGCSGVIANEYETSLLQEKMRMNLDQIIRWAGFYVETLGENGCTFFQDDKNTHIPAIGGLQVVDVTGCGDAFRAGFLYGFTNDKGLEECCKIACTAASFVIDKTGTQTHFFDKKEFNARLKKFYKV